MQNEESANMILWRYLRWDQLPRRSKHSHDYHLWPLAIISLVYGFSGSYKQLLYTIIIIIAILLINGILSQGDLVSYRTSFEWFYFPHFWYFLPKAGYSDFNACIVQYLWQLRMPLCRIGCLLFSDFLSLELSCANNFGYASQKIQLSVYHGLVIF